MATDSPATTTGSGGRLANEFCIKADLGEGGMLERTLSKRDDLRVAALENYATQKVQDGDGSPLIGARRPVHSPNKTTSTIASDTVLGADLQRQGSATFSSGAVPRASRSRSPVKRSTAAVLESYEEIVKSSQEETDFVSQGSEEPCGLDFLLQACDILEPSGPAATNGRTRPVRKTLPSAPPPERTQPARARRVRRNSDEDQYTNMESSEEEDYRPAGRGRAVRRPSAKAAAAAADGHAHTTAAAPIRWERGMVTGPCTNPDCEHPHDSPQWRKGPAQFPILCNACGTRWLRNGTLKPLVPRRGIRYSKPRPRTARAPPQSQSRAAAYVDEEEEEDIPAEQPVQRSRRYVEPAERAAPSMSELEQVAMGPYQHPMAAAAAAPLPGDALAAAMASIPGFPMPMFFPQHADAQQMHMDPAVMQHQLMAMNAAAQAAAQQFMNAMTEAANVAKLAPMGLPAGPVIHLNAVAGPAVPAPMFVQPPLAHPAEDAQMADV